MKKIVMVLGLVFSSGLVFARTGDFQDWKVLEITGPNTEVVYATGSIYVARIEVTSGVVTAGSNFQYWDSSSSDNGVARSTSLIYNTSTAGNKWEPSEKFSRGFMYSSTGTANVRMLWDWMINPDLTNPNHTQRNTGVK